MEGGDQKFIFFHFIYLKGRGWYFWHRGLSLHHPKWALVQIVVALLSIQFSDKDPGKAAEAGSSP